MRPTRIVVTRGATITSPDGKSWSKAEYTFEMEVEAPSEIQVAKAEAEATVSAWLAAFTMTATGPAGEPAQAPMAVDAFVVDAFRQATQMKDKPGRWMWSRNAPELKRALLASGGKATATIDGVAYDVKLGDSREEKNAFLSFWPQSG